MPQKKTKILLASLLITDLILAVIFFMMFSYTRSQISKTIEETNQIKIEIKKEESRSLMRKDIEDANNYKDIFNAYLIHEDDVVSFIKILESMVATSSLKSEVNSVTYQPSSTLTPIGGQLLRVNTTVTGEWKNIQFFLQLLENYPLQISIQKVSFDKSSSEINGKKVPQWSANFDFTVIILKK